VSPRYSRCVRQLHQFLWIGVAGLWLLTATACQFSTSPFVSPLEVDPSISATEREIPFQTVALEEWGNGYEGAEPLLLLVTQADELQQFATWLKPDHLQALNQIAFTEVAVVVLFRGLKGSSNYRTVIERITQRDGQLVVYAQFWEPNPQWASAAAETSPYHIVTISRAYLEPMTVEPQLQSYVLTPTPPAP
jgi:hypothetical protein